MANEQLRRARERSESPDSPGEHLSRQELADLVNQHVWNARGAIGSGARLRSQAEEHVSAGRLGQSDRTSGQAVRRGRERSGRAGKASRRERSEGGALSDRHGGDRAGRRSRSRLRQVGSPVRRGIAREAIHAQGLTLTELALVHADHLTATERAILHAARARALAKMRRADGTPAAVRRADDEFARSSPTEDPSWMRYYDMAQHLGDTAHALYDLALQGNRPGEARFRLSEAVGRHTRAHARSRTISRIELASLKPGSPESASITRVSISPATSYRGRTPRTGSGRRGLLCTGRCERSSRRPTALPLRSAGPDGAASSRPAGSPSPPAHRRSRPGCVADRDDLPGRQQESDADIVDVIEQQVTAAR